MSEQPKPTFVIADDHAMFREMVRKVLQEEGFSVAGEAANGDDAVRLCHELEPDIAVLDLTMPGLNGIDAARAIKKRHPNTRIIMLTMHCEEQYVLGSLRAGAAAFVVKSQGVSSLLEAIRATCKGHIYVSGGCVLEANSDRPMRFPR